MPPDLPERLRSLGRLLAGEPEAEDLAALRDLVERDLLPRLATGGGFLIAGIVGPNNAGKSTLFNTLAGAPLSEARPEGGATRRLLGAAHPETLAALRASSWPAFRLVETEPDEDGEDGPPALRVLAAPGLAPGLLLVDTPDFDSIHQKHPRQAAALLTVADLVIVVVTRHTYRNAEVVAFLRRWLACGRPWILLYNEAPDAATAARHAADLAADLGAPPRAVFASPHRLEVQAGGPLLLEKAAGEGPAELGAALADPAARARLKKEALEAGLRRLAEEAGRAAARRRRTLRAVRETRESAAARARSLARAVAEAAWPLGLFLEAFREVLEARGHPVQRLWRRSLRRARLGLTRLLRRRPPEDPASALQEPAVRALEASWAGVWEDLVRDLGPEGRLRLRDGLPPGLREALDRDLAPGRSREAAARARAALQEHRPDRGAFQKACRNLVEAALEERGRSWDLQALADLVSLAPLAAAAVVVVKTGGLGADLAAGGAGALGSALAERHAHLLGSGLVRRARARWVEQREEELAEALLEVLLPDAAPGLAAQEARSGALVEVLEAWSPPEGREDAA